MTDTVWPKQLKVQWSDIRVTLWLTDTSRHWHFPAVSVGTHGYITHTFLPFPLIPMFTLSFAEISILLFYFVNWSIPILLSSFPTPGGEYAFYFCSCFLWLQLVLDTHWPLAYLAVTWDTSLSSTYWQKWKGFKLPILPFVDSTTLGSLKKLSHGVG